MKNAIAKQQQINQELTVLIDEDLQQEQELLKALIEEILAANEKIKKAHFERVEDTEAKLKVLNAEVQRIRKTISAQDDTVAEKRLALLEETKEDYFEALSELRLKDVKSHFSEPIRNHLKALTNRLETTNAKRKSTKLFNQNLLSFYQGLILDLEMDAKNSIENTGHLDGKFEAIREHSLPVLSQFSEFITPIKETLTELLNNHLTNINLEEINELFIEIDKIKNQDLEDLVNQKNALNEALKDALIQIDEGYNNELESRLDNALGSQKETFLTESVQLKLEALSALQTKIQDAMILGDNAKALRNEYTKQLNDLYKTSYGKVLKKVTKSLKSEAKLSIENKKRKRKEHLEQLYEIYLQEKERTIQSFIDIFSLNLRTMIERSNHSEPLFESTYQALQSFIGTLYDLEMAQINLQKTVLEKYNEFALAINKVNAEKMALSKRYETLIKQLQIKTLNTLEEKHTHFSKMHVQLQEQLEIERLELNRIYGLDKILNARLRFISKSKIARLDEIQALKHQLYQDESDISLAEKEYDIQVLKAQSLYDHERAINKVQTERVDAGVRVNKAMVQATVKRQVNFADQQIKFAEAEYAARLEHIEYTLNQELQYTEETLGYHQKAFEKRRQDIDIEYASKKHSNAQKKKLFQHSQMLKKVLNEEVEIDLEYASKVEAFENEVKNDIRIKRYLDQIQKANEHADNARKDALELKNKDIESFQALRQESLDRLANIEAMMTEPDLLPYHQESVNDLASERLSEMLASAESFLNDKIKEPKKRIEDTKDRLLELEKQTLSTDEIQKLTDQEKALNASFEASIEQLKIDTEKTLLTLDKRLNDSLSKSDPVLNDLEQRLEAPLTSDDSLQASYANKLSKSLSNKLLLLEETRVNAQIEKDDLLNKISHSLNKTIEVLIDHRVKTQMVLENVEHRQQETVKTYYDELKKSFKKEVKKIK